MASGRTDHWTKMRRSLAKFSELEASNQTPSFGLTTTTPEHSFQYTQRMITLPIRDFTVSVARKTQPRAVFKEL
jgi:hypothetical protein